MPKTYANYSREILGYVATPTYTNTTYITVMKADKWIKQGKKPSQILLGWNAGEGATQCSKGINKQGIPYDSCHYVEKGLLALNR
jgi:hypothetical protein